MLKQRPCVFSVFWFGASNRIYFGKAENLSYRWYFQLQEFNSSLTPGGRQEREDDGLEVEAAVLDEYTICPAAQALLCNCPAAAWQRRDEE